MITLYTYGTPNGRKASILLEEIGLRYWVRKLDLPAGENHTPEYLEINPIGKIPALVEDLPGGRRRRLFGSGAILLYFAERTGLLMPTAIERRTEALSWLMMGISDLSPAGIYKYHFAVRAPEPIPYAAEFFLSELTRYLKAIDQRLSKVEYLAEEYSIADIACYPFTAVAAMSAPELLDTLPNLKRWYETLSARPAVQRGMAVPE